jgi:hypothetical protein
MNQIKKAYKKKYGDVSENMLGIFSDGWKIGRSELEAENERLRFQLKRISEGGFLTCAQLRTIAEYALKVGE